MTIEINANQESLHLSLSETMLLQLCKVQTLTAANRKKILSLLDKALPELVATFLEESVEVQALLPKSNNPPGFKPVFVNLKTPRALWGEADEELPDGTVFLRGWLPIWRSFARRRHVQMRPAGWWDLCCCVWARMRRLHGKFEHEDVDANMRRSIGQHGHGQQWPRWRHGLLPGRADLTLRRKARNTVQHHYISLPNQGHNA